MNTAVPYVNCFAYANDAQTNRTTICFNNNLTSSETVTLSGAGAPTGLGDPDRVSQFQQCHHRP